MEGTSDKKRLVATVLCALFGPLGVHRIVLGSFTDKDGKKLVAW